ncbi:unnamed protein product [Heligmosomoides polygyrus]|uniref:ZP domain-containing protein n=1 Tax=Heligmosomoides polygyrus TaxID=6339 RepID=A0A183GQP8_HELPZ|nr:unnamed protein product [Heligmosomoides polygyrus]
MEKVIHDFYSGLFESHVHLPPCHLSHNGYVVSSVLPSEIRHAISSVKKRTAPGPDRIRPEHLKSLPPALINILARLFTPTCRSARWKTSSTLLLHRRGDAHDISNHRPICLLSVVCKLFTGDIRASDTSAGSKVGFFVATKSCGVARVNSMEPAGHNYTLILHMKHHNALVTGGDRAYLLQCFIGKPLEDQELTADLGVMKGELMIAETISLSSVPPTCAYSIRKDAPNGTIVTNAFVGQTVYHRWECDGEQGEFESHRLPQVHCFVRN